MIMQLTPVQAEILLSSIKEDLPVLLFQLDSDGVVLNINSYCREILGTGTPGRNFADLLVEFHDPFTLSRYLNKESHSPLTLDIPDSLPKTFLFSFHSIDETILVIGKNDTRESDRLSSELLSANQELNNLTRSLHKKNAELEYLNIIKNQFLGMAAHDLRQPIRLLSAGPGLGHEPGRTGADLHPLLQERRQDRRRGKYRFGSSHNAKNNGHAQGRNRGYQQGRFRHNLYPFFPILRLCSETEVSGTGSCRSLFQSPNLFIFLSRPCLEILSSLAALVLFAPHCLRAFLMRMTSNRCTWLGRSSSPPFSMFAAWGGRVM